MLLDYNTLEMLLLFQQATCKIYTIQISRSFPTLRHGKIIKIKINGHYTIMIM
jgi:hypothetical protein